MIRLLPSHGYFIKTKIRQLIEFSWRIFICIPVAGLSRVQYHIYWTRESPATMGIILLSDLPNLNHPSQLYIRRRYIHFLQMPEWGRR